MNSKFTLFIALLVSEFWLEPIQFKGPVKQVNKYMSSMLHIIALIRITISLIIKNDTDLRLWFTDQREVLKAVVTLRTTGLKMTLDKKTELSAETDKRVPYMFPCSFMHKQH